MQSSFSGDSIGVGLHLSYELVQVHKGTIEYKDNDGGGSVFTVCIPTDKNVYSEKDFLIPGNVLLKEAGGRHIIYWNFRKTTGAGENSRAFE